MGQDQRYHDVVWGPKQVARLWDYYGSSQAHTSQYFSRIFGADILRHIQRHGVDLSRRDVLDFGCGPGFLMEHLAQDGRARSITGLEFSTASVRKATERLHGKRAFERVMLADALPSALPDESFDVVFLVEVVEHLDDPILDATLREAHRLLRTGGHLVVTTPNREDLDKSLSACPDCGCVFHIWQHVRSWSAQTLSARLETAGFRRLVATDVYWRAGPEPPWWRSIAREALLGARRRLSGATSPYLLYIGEKTNR